QVLQIRRAREVREIRDIGQAQEIKGQLEALTVTLPARAGDGGRLFGSVTAADVVAAVKAAGGPEVDRRRVQLPGHIKSTGAHNVDIRIHPEVVATVALD